jgi:hypothetical protein
MIGFDTDWISVSPAKGGSNGAALFGTHSAGLRGDKKSICVTGSNYQGQLGNSTTNDLAFFTCETADLTLELQNIANELSTLLVYPNPSNGKFTIESVNSNFDHVQFTITNLTGETIINGVLTENSTVQLIDQPSGIYFIQFEKEGISHLQKLIIQ